MDKELSEILKEISVTEQDRALLNKFGFKTNKGTTAREAIRYLERKGFSLQMIPDKFLFRNIVRAIVGHPTTGIIRYEMLSAQNFDEAFTDLLLLIEERYMHIFEMENNTQNKDLSRNDGNTMLDDVKIIWHNPESRKPLCYQSGDWDGKRSDNVLVELKNGNYVVAICYEGIVDGCRFYDWYYGVDEWELTESEVRRWMKIPD